MRQAQLPAQVVESGSCLALGCSVFWFSSAARIGAAWPSGQVRASRTTFQIPAGDQALGTRPLQLSVPEVYCSLSIQTDVPKTMRLLLFRIAAALFAAFSSSSVAAAQTQYFELRMRSDSLSAFWGQPVAIEAHVLLPEAGVF